RPHPRSGVVNPAYGAANERIVAAIVAANDTDPGAGHVYDDGPELGWQLAAADIAVVDISAMVYDRLALDKPLLVTRPVDPAAAVDVNGYLGAAEWLTADAAPGVLFEAERVASDDDAVTRRTAWVHHYFGDTTPGAASARFHEALARLMATWEQWHQRSGTADGDADEAELDEDTA
ncbi:MAG: hypothetical protein ACK5KK_11255, partial [Microbacterium sp.]